MRGICSSFFFQYLDSSYINSLLHQQSYYLLPLYYISSTIPSKKLFRYSTLAKPTLLTPHRIFNTILLFIRSSVMAAATFSFRWTASAHDDLTEATFLRVDWAALLQVCREQSGDPACVYQGDDYHAGGRHIIRRIELNRKGELWLARIPKLPSGPGKQWTPHELFVMESEIATMKHIANNTEIPVPKVYSYSCTAMNDVKAPFLLMQCIEGNMLFDLGGPSVLDAEKNLQMCKTLAWIQVRYHCRYK